MFRNYLKIALRNLSRFKIYSLINISGLAIGFACCLIIAMYVHYEWSYDNFHEKGDRTYRALFGGNADSPEQLADYLKDHFPEVEQAVRIDPLRGSRLLHFQDKCFYEENVYEVEPSFFQMFSFGLKKGDPETALQAPNSMVISDYIAQKYFGDVNPIGKVVTMGNRDDYVITGLLKENKIPSHLHMDIMIPFYKLGLSKWYYVNCHTYVTLRTGSNPYELEEKFLKSYSDYAGQKRTGFFTSKFHLQPVTSINLQQAADGEGRTGRGSYSLFMFSVIAVLILMIAFLNFINLSTTYSLKRSDEVLIRKSCGALRMQLVLQSLIELLFIVLCAFIFAILVVEISLPLINSIIQKPLGFSSANFRFLAALSFYILLFTLIGPGLYSAFIFSVYRPAFVFKGYLKSEKQGFRLRNLIVISQFSITVILIVSLLILNLQMKFIHHKNLGFDRENVIVIQDRVDVTDNHFHALRNELNRIPGVLYITSGDLPISEYGRSTMYEKPYSGSSTESIRTRELDVDYNYIETLGIRLLKGRSFSIEHSEDVNQKNVLVNEAVVNYFGWDYPVGQTFKEDNEEFHIIGVFADMHLGSIYEYIWPTMMKLEPGPRNIIVRLKAGEVETALTQIRKTWQEFAYGAPLHFFFLDEKIDAIYANEQRMENLFSLFTLIAICVSCIGLYGLVAFTSENRTKEIGIRKVVGASVPSILALLVKDFVKWILLANLIAWPIAWYAMNKWLQNFAYRIELTIWPFLLSGLIALGIALLTVSWQVVRAARANPVESLRYE